MGQSYYLHRNIPATFTSISFDSHILSSKKQNYSEAPHTHTSTHTHTHLHIYVHTQMTHLAAVETDTKLVICWSASGDAAVAAATAARLAAMAQAGMPGLASWLGLAGLGW